MSGVVHLLDGTGHGGDATVALALAEAQQRRGHSVRIHLGASPHSGQFVDRAYRQGIEALEVPGVKHEGAEPRLTRLRALAAAIGRGRPDVLHVHCGGLSLRPIDALACRVSGVPTRIATIHGAMTWADYHDPLHEQRRWRRAARAFHTITAPTAAAADEQRSSGINESQLVVMANPVSRQVTGTRSSGLRTALAIPDDASILMFVGRLEPVKGVTNLLEAFGRLAAQFSRWHLVYIGTGSLADALDSRAGQLGLTERVHLPGFMEDVPAALQLCDVFAHPSHSESFGLSVVEAMAGGCAVVATNVGVVTQLHELPPSLVVVTPGDDDELVRGLRHVMRDDEFRSGLAHRAPDAVAMFAADRVAADFERLYMRGSAPLARAGE